MMVNQDMDAAPQDVKNLKPLGDDETHTPSISPADKIVNNKNNIDKSMTETVPVASDEVMETETTNHELQDQDEKESKIEDRTELVEMSTSSPLEQVDNPLESFTKTDDKDQDLVDNNDIPETESQKTSTDSEIVMDDDNVNGNDSHDDNVERDVDSLERSCGTTSDKTTDSKIGQKSQCKHDGQESRSQPPLVKDAKTLVTQVSEVAQESEADTVKGFDLNQEVCSEEVDNPINPVTSTISFVSASQPSAASGLSSTPLQFEVYCSSIDDKDITRLRLRIILITLPGRITETCNNKFCIWFPSEKCLLIVSPVGLSAAFSHQTSFTGSPRSPTSSSSTSMLRHRRLDARVVLSDLRTGINSGREPRLSDSTGISLVFSEEESSVEANPRGPTKMQLDLNSIMDEGCDGHVTFVNQTRWQSPSHSSSSSSKQPSLNNIDLNLSDQPESVVRIFGSNFGVKKNDPPVQPTVSNLVPTQYGYNGSSLVPPISFPQQPSPFLMNMAPAGSSGLGLSHHNFDLNTGLLINGGNWETNSVLRQFLPQNGNEQYLRTRSPSGSIVGGKRHVPDSGWDFFPASKHQQQPWR
nr:hypothetical protein [Tanacetum cinerariifolium]